ncbi:MULTISPECIES: nucleotidyltransferase family protein [Actinomyces]|uniref:Nucleotidyltransferase domain-containing protein n=1 Tax=Actinomyces respiraculi TaxID=2744574 RepID=A0A7T0PXT3_9ACTO|nr:MULTISPECIES: nucleotidyltransferase domain-containing protein [Actinomyces]QPL05950.1 nucleotidyltransferase domain-containing protein [Actinomyces respiraculi]
MLSPETPLPSAPLLARACQEHGAARLHLFGSATTDRFDPASSDLDFLVDFLPGRADRLADDLGFLGGLARLTGKPVDVVIAESMRNPYLAALATAEELYAA